MLAAEAEKLPDASRVRSRFLQSFDKDDRYSLRYLMLRCLTRVAAASWT